MRRFAGAVGEISAPADAAAVALHTADGWRAIIVPRPSSTTVALRWLVAAGGRHDGVRPGLSYLTRRLVFRAPQPDRLDPAASLEALGAELGGDTARDYAELHAIVAAPHRAHLFALIPALARPPALGDTELARQKAHIVAQLTARRAPARAVWDLLHEALWGDHPLARPPEGSAEAVAALTAADVASHHAAHYRPARTVLIAVGAATVDEVRAAMDSLPRPRLAADPPPELPPHPADGTRRRFKWAGDNLTHLAAALPVPGLVHADRTPLRLLDYVLGRGGSSRLYRALRERRHLVYSCGSVYMPYADCGLLAVTAACPPADTAEVAACLADGLCGLADAPPTEAELRAVRTRYAGALPRACESNASLASLLGVETLLGARETLGVSAGRAAALTIEDLAAVARRYCVAGRLAWAAVGPVDPFGG